MQARHEVVYVDADEHSAYRPETRSERRLSEYLGSPRSLAGQMDGVEVLAVQGAPVTAEVLAAAGALRLVACARGGPVNVDVEAVAARGLPLVNTPGKNSEAVADLTLAYLIMLARGFPRAMRFLQQGNRIRDNWEGARFMGSDLRGHTLGLIGYGQVGQRVALRARAFAMTVLVFDPYVQAADGEQVATLAELLARSDFVSLHARATPANERLIDAAALAAMKPGAFLLNTARESLVDEAALDAALGAGRLGGAALDVFEPAPAGARLSCRSHRVRPPAGEEVMERLVGGEAHDLGGQAARRRRRHRKLPRRAVHRGRRAGRHRAAGVHPSRAARRRRIPGVRHRRQLGADHALRPLGAGAIRRRPIGGQGGERHQHA